MAVLATLQREVKVLEAGLEAGVGAYKRVRWLLVVLFSSVVLWTTSVATDWPVLGQIASFLLAGFGFWFVPDFLERPVQALAMYELRSAVKRVDDEQLIPTTLLISRPESGWVLTPSEPGSPRLSLWCLPGV